MNCTSLRYAGHVAWRMSHLSLARHSPSPSRVSFIFTSRNRTEHMCNNNLYGYKNKTVYCVRSLFIYYAYDCYLRLVHGFYRV